MRFAFPNNDIKHRPRQVVSPNYLVWEKHSKEGIHGAHEPIAKIRLPSWLHRVDICRPEDVEPRKPSDEQRLLSFSFIAREGHPASTGLVRSTSAEKRECRVGAARVK